MDLAQLAIRADSSDLVRAKRDLDALPASSKRAESATSGLSKSYSSLGVVATKLIGILGAAGLGRAFLVAVDANTKFTAQLKLATQTQTQFNTALADVQRIAKTAQSDIGSVATLYARLNSSLREFGVTQKEVARITENVGLALKVSGATAAESSSAILQLSQAFASGVLRGEEFNAVAESAPVLMRALADSIGVPIGQLRSMAAEGQITGEVLNKAFGDERLLDKFRQQAQEVKTIAGAFTQLKNSLVILSGQVSTTSGVGASFADILSTIARNIESVANVIKGDLKGAFDSILPAYREFKRLQDKEASRALPAATTAAGGILPTGSRIDQPLRRDLGLISDVTETAAAFNGLKKQLDEFRTNNPLKDLTTANQEYAQGLAVIRANVLAMNLTQEEGKRYEAQLKSDWEKATKGSTKAVTETVDKNKEYQKQLGEQLVDLKSINSLLQQGVDLEKARLIVNETRKGATKQQIEDYQKQIDIQADIEEAEKARQDRLQVWINTQQKAYEDELKAIEATKKANEDASKEYLRTVQKAEDDKRKEYERTAEQLNRSLTDALLRGFESGKGFARNFRDTLINMFKSLVLTPVINFILKPVSEGLAGFLGGITGGGGQSSFIDGIMQDKKTGFGGVLSDLGSIFTKSNQSIIGGIESVGASIANGMGGIRDTIGGYLGTNASFVANAASYAGAVLQLAEGNWAGAAGTAIGTYFGGPVGGAIGSFLGNAVGSLFGGKKIPMTGDQAQTSYSAGKLTSSTNTFGKKSLGGGASLQSANEAFASSLGTLINEFDKTATVVIDTIYRSRTNTQGFLRVNGKSIAEGSQKKIGFEDFIKKMMGPGLAAAIRQSPAIPQAFKDLFNGLTVPEAVTETINAVVKLNQNSGKLQNTLGITAQQVALLATESGIAGANLTKLVDTLTATSGALFTIGDAMVQMKQGMTDAFGSITNQSLPKTLVQFDAAIKSLDKTTEQGRQSFLALINLRAGFEAFTNQMEALKGGTKGALFSLAGLAEQQEIMFGDLVKMFAELGQEVPSSTSELIALGKSIDYTTAKGINLAAVFPQLTQAFTLYQSSLESGIGALQETRGAIENDLVRALQKLRNNIDDAKSELQEAFDVKAGGLTNRITELTTLSKNLREFVKGLRGVVNTPTQNLRALQDDFKSAYKLGLLGNLDAANSLVDIGGNLAEATVSNATSSIEAQRGLALIANQTLQVATVADRQKTVAEQQLSELQKLVGGVLNLSAIEINSSALQTVIGTTLVNAMSANGNVSATAFRAGLQGKATDAQITALISAVDTNADNQLSTAEILNSALIESNATLLDLMSGNADNNIQTLVAQITELQSIETEVINTAINNGFGNLLLSNGIIQQSNEQIRNEAIGIKSTLQSLVDIQSQIANVTVANFAREQAVRDAAAAKMQADRIAAAEQEARDAIARAEAARAEAARVAAEQAAKAAEIKRLQAEGLALRNTPYSTPLSYGGYTMMNGMNSGMGGGGVLGSFYQNRGTVDTSKIAALRAQITALGGVPQFANGGAFTNGIVSKPTMFNMGRMGEAGSEAIMPLSNVGGKLGVRSSGDNGTREEIKLLRQEMNEVLKSINKNVFLTNRQLRDWSDGERLNVNVMQEVGEVVAVAA